ncbi:hypothetical protein WJX75_007427 [Coccomyxa subellipsoidea]|uniref:Tyrosine specific protein phosphatases domain-containing protein n=1 Tax=Coccomyxa subellipsoidea TaxID=248742 RepID=A0ABR2YSJ0_9CHLO
MDGIWEFWQGMKHVFFNGTKGLQAPNIFKEEIKEGEPISLPSDSRIRNLHSVPNFRDLASASVNIRPGVVYRCACPYQSSSCDLAIIGEELKITHLLDLRTSYEWKEDKPSGVVQDATIWKSRRDSRGCVQLEQLSDSDADKDGFTIYRVSLQEWSIYTRAFVLRLPMHRAFPILLWLALAKVLGWKPPVHQVRSRVIAEANQEGLYGMYVTILGAFRPEIACALRVVLEAVKAKEPLALFCKLGKDRTGLLTMLILACCGISDEEIVADYIRSKHIPSLKQDPTLKKLKGFNAEVFSKAPATTLMAILQHLRLTYGSIPAYLRSCGFLTEEQNELAALLAVDACLIR